MPEKGQRTAVRLLSCEGGASQWVESVPFTRELRLNDAEWITGVRWRLGLPLYAQGTAVCQLQAATKAKAKSKPKSAEAQINPNAEAQTTYAEAQRISAEALAEAQTPISSMRCGRCLDSLGDHAVCCPLGGGFYRVHGSIARCCAGIAKECKAEAYLEEVCPQLIKGAPGTAEAEEARLDVHIWAAGPSPAEWWVDVTHHHPWAHALRKEALEGLSLIHI